MLPGAASCLLATYRPGYRPPWLDKSYAAQIPLHPLVRQDSQRVLDAGDQSDTPGGNLGQDDPYQGEGNPFFLEQLALHAARIAALRWSNRCRRRSAMSSWRASIACRNKPGDCWQIAAVIGREFSLRVVSEVWDAGGPLEPLLRHLLQLEFLYERLEPTKRRMSFVTR